MQGMSRIPHWKQPDPSDELSLLLSRPSWEIRQPWKSDLNWWADRFLFCHMCNINESYSKIKSSDFHGVCAYQHALRSQRLVPWPLWEEPQMRCLWSIPRNAWTRQRLPLSGLEKSYKNRINRSIRCRKWGGVRKLIQGRHQVRPIHDTFIIRIFTTIWACNRVYSLSFKYTLKLLLGSN